VPAATGVVQHARPSRRVSANRTEGRAARPVARPAVPLPGRVEYVDPACVSPQVGARHGRPRRRTPHASSMCARCNSCCILVPRC